jgi:hypothetical protein
MTVEQAAEELLETLESMYMNDFGGYQCNAGEAKDIDSARDRLGQALDNRTFNELTQGEIMQMDLLSYTSVVDLAWAIEAKVKEKNQWI